MTNCDPMAVADKLASQIKHGAFLTVRAGERLNTMTIGWGMTGFIWQMPVFMVAVRDSRYTFELMEAASDFTVSLPYGDLAQALKVCGTKSGRDVDKFAAGGLNAVAAQQVTSPVLDFAGLHYECKIRFKAPMDPSLLDAQLEYLYPAKDYHSLYFGEIAACYETA